MAFNTTVAATSNARRPRWTALRVCLGLVAAMACCAQAAPSPQAITFVQPADKVFGAAAFAVSAMASSGLAVGIASLTSTVCTVSVKTITLVAAGTCTLRATQGGNSTFAAAASIDRSFKVAKTNQAITFKLPATAIYGGPKITLVATATSKLAVVFTSKSAAICTVAGNTLSLVAAGSCVVQASQPGSANFNAAPAVTGTLVVAKASQTTSFTLPASSTFGAAALSLAATASSGLPVTFASTTPATCTVSVKTLKIVGAGSCVVRATQGGNGNYSAAPAVDRTLKIAKANQTIAFAALAARTFGAVPFAVAATATSKLPVSFASMTATTCSVAGNSVALLAAGTCTVRAAQPGNVNFNVAPVVNQSFAIAKAKQSITLASVAAHRFGDPPFALVATASSGLPVTFASTTTATCHVSGATLTIVAAGICTVRASQAGNASYLAATDVTTSTTIAKSVQSITFDAIADHPLSDSPIALKATSSSGLAVVFASMTTTTCNVSASNGALVGTGTCTIRASQPGNVNFAAAAPVDRSFFIRQAAQTITFPEITGKTYGNPPFGVTATSSSALPVALVSLTGAVCTSSGASVTLIAAGTCTLRASQAGDAHFAAATPVDRSFVVAKSSQTIAFAPLASRPLSNPPFTVAAVASSSLPVQFVSGTPSVCTVTGVTVTLVHAGDCRIDANQSGNANFNPAPAVSQAFTVANATQAITFDAIGDQSLAASPVTARASASSGLPVTLTSSTPAICTVAGSLIALIGAGSCTIHATQPGNSVYPAAVPVDRQFQVLAIAQTIEFPPPGDRQLSAVLVVASAIATSGLPVEYASLTPSICTTDGSASIALAAIGQCIVRASQPGNARFAAATDVDRSFNVLSGTSKIVFDPIGAQTLAASPLVLSASSPSKLPILFSAQPPAVCVATGSSLSLVAPGICNVTASESTDGVHPGGVPVTRSFAVLRTPTFKPATVLTVGPWPKLVLAGRFRDPRIVDLVVPWQTSIAILAGDGSGSFTVAGNTTVGVFPMSGAAADFNNDGNADFAISYIGSQMAGVYPGDGKGGFNSTLDWPTVATAAGIVAGDLDGDGNPDLMVASADSGGVSGQSLTYLAGNGDGSFAPGATIPTCGSPLQLVAADLNNDAVADLIATCDRDQGITVLLRHADNSFDFFPLISEVPVPFRLAVGDFDRDGNVDIVATSRYGIAMILLGDGTGRFHKVAELAGMLGGDCVVADFNADGIADVAFADPLNNILSIFAGAGDGSFAAPIRLTTGNYPTGLSTADVDGDGSVDMLYANMLDGTVSILRNNVGVRMAAHAIVEYPATQAAPFGGPFRDPLSVRVTDSSDAPIPGFTVRFELPVGTPSAIFGNGARKVEVTTDETGVATSPRIRAGRVAGSYAATARAGALSVAISLTNQAAGTPPAFVSGAAPAGALGAPYIFALAASGSPAPRFSVASGTLPPGVSLSPAGHLSGTPGAGGTYTGVFKASNGNAPDATQPYSIVIGVPGQTITFNAIADQPIDRRAAGVVAAATSGLPIAFQSLTPQICTIGGSTAALLKAGHCTIRATQPGNERVTAATPVDRSFDITKGVQSVTLTLPHDAYLFAPPAFVDSSASSGLPVTLSSLTATICTVVDNAHVNFIARGTCTIRASQAGNGDYGAAQMSASVSVTGATQTIYFPQPVNGHFGEPTYLLATASSGLPVTLESLTTAVCKVVGNSIGIGDDPSAPGNWCTVRASQPGNDIYRPALAIDVTFPFGFDPSLPMLPPPTPHIVYATYLGGLGSDLAFDVVAGPDGSPFVGGIAGTTNFPKLPSQQYSNGGLGLDFVSKLQSQSGKVDYSVAVGAPTANPTAFGAVAEIAALQAMAIAPSGDVIVAAYPGGADFPQREGSYVRQSSIGIFKVDASARVTALSPSLDAAIQTIRAIACDKSGAIYLTGVAASGLATSANAAIATLGAGVSAPFLMKLSPAGLPVYSTYLTTPKSRPSGTHDIGQGKNDAGTTSLAITVDGAGNAYVAGQSTAADFPATPGALDTNDSNNRDAFVVKVNAPGTAISFVARVGFRDIDRATAIALEPDGTIVVAGKSASVDDFLGSYSFQPGVHFSQNNMQTLRVDREFGFVAQLDANATRVIFMAAIGSFGGDLVEHAFEPSPRPLKIAVDPAGFIYVAGTGADDRTLPLMGLMPGMAKEGVFLMKVSPNGGQRYSTFLGEGVATGVATDGFGNAYVTGYSRGPMPTMNAEQADCVGDALSRCVTPFVLKVNDAPAPVSLKSPAPSIEVGTSLTLTATVGDLRASGTIRFSEDGTVLATVPVTGGAASLSVTPSLGFHHYVATFQGTGYANGMSSFELVQAIVQKATQ
jgi:hypothetical protein